MLASVRVRDKRDQCRRKGFVLKNYDGWCLFLFNCGCTPGFLVWCAALALACRGSEGPLHGMPWWEFYHIPLHGSSRGSDVDINKCHSVSLQKGRPLRKSCFLVRPRQVGCGAFTCQPISKQLPLTSTCVGGARHGAPRSQHGPFCGDDPNVCKDPTNEAGACANLMPARPL